MSITDNYIYDENDRLLTINNKTNYTYSNNKLISIDNIDSNYPISAKIYSNEKENGIIEFFL